MGLLDVSLTTVDALAPPAVTVKVSAPSVELSLSRVAEIVAPLYCETYTEPLSEPLTSSELMPDSV